MNEPTPTEASAEMWFYVSGLLMAFMEPADPRMTLIRKSVLERVAAIEAEARKQERERLRAAIMGWERYDLHFDVLDLLAEPSDD